MFYIVINYNIIDIFSPQYCTLHLWLELTCTGWGFSQFRRFQLKNTFNLLKVVHPHPPPPLPPPPLHHHTETTNRNVWVCHMTRGLVLLSTSWNILQMQIFVNAICGIISHIWSNLHIFHTLLLMEDSEVELFSNISSITWSFAPPEYFQLLSESNN